MSSLMEAVFPILLTLLTAVGAVSSVAIYKPIVAILTGGVSILFSNILYPIFILSFIFVIISNLSSNFKLNKFNDFLSSSFKWISGFVLTIFSSFLAIQGISAGRFDSVSIKATKFAVKSYVPIIGSFISEGFEFIMLSSVLIKNAIGVGVLFLIFLTILTPIIKIILFKLGLQLVSAIIEPMGNSRLSNFTTSCSKVLVYPIVILLGVAFMFLLTVALIMCTANIF
jgi:stage III sporulation protein AE